MTALAVGYRLTGPGTPPRHAIAAVPVPGFPSGLSLLLSAEDARHLAAAAPGLTARVLGGPSTVVLGTPEPAGPGRPGGPGEAAAPGRASPGAVFTSYAEFRQALSLRLIPDGVRAVSYDPERWPATPPGEQASPAGYMRLFARAATAAGYTPILVPGRDLVLARGARCPARPHETLDAAFLRCGLPAAAARAAPVFEVQAAPEERDTARMSTFVAACARQARAANPHVAVLATLSTDPLGHPVTGRQLARAAAALRPWVQGIQLNLSGSSVSSAFAFLRTVRERPTARLP